MAVLFDKLSATERNGW